MDPVTRAKGSDGLGEIVIVDGPVELAELEELKELLDSEEVDENDDEEEDKLDRTKSWLA